MSGREKTTPDLIRAFGEDGTSLPPRFHSLDEPRSEGFGQRIFTQGQLEQQLRAQSAEDALMTDPEFLAKELAGYGIKLP